MVVVAVALVFAVVTVVVWMSFLKLAERKAGEERAADGWHTWKIDPVQPVTGKLVRVIAENAEANERFGIEFLSKDRKLKAGDAIVVYYADLPDSYPAVVDVRREAGEDSIMDESGLDEMGKTSQVDLWTIELTAVPSFKRPDGTYKS